MPLPSRNPDRDFSAGYDRKEIEPDWRDVPSDWRDVPTLSLDDIDHVIRQRFGRLISDAMRRHNKDS
jgi:hypothetical protein